MTELAQANKRSRAAFCFCRRCSVKLPQKPRPFLKRKHPLYFTANQSHSTSPAVATGSDVATQTTST